MTVIGVTQVKFDESDHLSCLYTNVQLQVCNSVVLISFNIYFKFPLCDVCELFTNLIEVIMILILKISL